MDPPRSASPGPASTKWTRSPEPAPPSFRMTDPSRSSSTIISGMRLSSKPSATLLQHPARAVEKVAHRTAGFRTWTEGDIAAFEARHPAGSRARLALALLLYTGQRRSDVVLMGRQHRRGDLISVVQRKTGKALDIKLHSRLKAELSVAPVYRPRFVRHRIES